MEAQPNGSVSGHHLLGVELTEMLEGVVLPEMSRVHQHCIYRVRQSLRQVNPEAYTPLVVSIGPFHNPWGSGQVNNALKPMEELKRKYLKGFLHRTQLSVADFLLKLDKYVKLEEWENRIRSCYAEPINGYNSKGFLKMIITDACFIIEHFLRCYAFHEWKENDPLLKTSLYFDVYMDLILLENQLPFFVLEDIYKYNLASRKPASFVEITFHYFNPLNLQNKNPQGVCPKHFTDLLRTFLLPPSSDLGQEETDYAIDNIHSASQLSDAGLVFKVSENRKCLLDLKFDKGVLTMTSFPVAHDTEAKLRNILAFEDCHFPYSSSVSQYFWILDNLINTEKDVNILVDKKIIVNCMGDTNSVAIMVNNLCKHILVRSLNSKYVSLCHSLNGFYENPFNKYKAIFVREYFNTPVKIASTIAAVLLLLFTLIQTVFSVCSFLNE